MLRRVIHLRAILCLSRIVLFYSRRLSPAAPVLGKFLSRLYRPHDEAASLAGWIRPLIRAIPTKGLFSRRDRRRNVILWCQAGPYSTPVKHRGWHPVEVPIRQIRPGTGSLSR